MPYAAGDTLSSAPLEAGIEITDEQYREALLAKLEGLEAIVVNNSLVIRNKQPSEFHVWENGEWVEHLPEPEPEPEPEPAQQRPWIVAQARLGIDPDGNVTGIGGDTGFAGAFPLTEGYIYIQFTEDQETDQYIVSPTPIGPYLCYVANGDQYSDSFALTCTDLMGTPATPECIPLLVSKVG